MNTRPIISFDYALKRLLRQKANHDILEGFLSELLKRQIKIKNILDSESNQEKADDKQTRVDLLVKDATGALMIIELQYQHEIDYLLRMLFGVSKTIVDHMSQGQSYGKVKKVYSINIIYFTLGEGDDYIYHGQTEFKGIHTQQLLQLTPKQRERFRKDAPRDLYPEYYILEVKHFDDVARNTLDEWIYYLKNNTIKDDFKAQGMDKVRARLDYYNLTLEERKRYDKDIDRKLGWDSAIETARIDGEEIGIKKGEEIGMKKGRAEGEEIGREKALEAIILENHRAGLSMELIQSFTRVSMEKIIEIIEQNE